MKTEDVQVVSGGGGDVAASVKYKGIAVCGSNPHTKAQAPFDDPGWLIYACSPDNTPCGLSKDRSALPRCDVWFEVHNPVFDKTRPYEYLAWISQQQHPIYMRDRFAMGLRGENGQPLFPNARAYPEKELKERFGPFTFTSSIAFIMAKAIVDIEDLRAKGQIAEEPPMLGLFGILQRSQEEYEKQRAGTQNMIWHATQSGIRVLAADLSGLFEPPPEIF